MNKNNNLQIKKLNSIAEAEICAKMMADTEPWITLERNYESALKIITDSSREVYVTTIDETIVGFSILNMQGAFIGYIQSICIDHKFRNKGIGTNLIDHAEKRIFSETPNVFMCVSSFNKDAQRLYLRNGYEIIGELKDYIVTGHSEILLRKTISSLKDFSIK
ncbi:MAG: GNAT family N-acetyltransferase [bacterium]